MAMTLKLRSHNNRSILITVASERKTELDNTRRDQSLYAKKNSHALALLSLCVFLTFVLFFGHSAGGTENQSSHAGDEKKVRSNVIPDGDASFTWSVQGDAWQWTDNTSQNIFVPHAEPYTRLPLDTLTKNETTIVFYGSSHLRELYFSLIRLRRGISWQEKLEPIVMQVGGGIPDKLNNRDINSCGGAGVDIANCGQPGKRLVPELGKGVAIGFKTFLHTPDAEDLFVEFLSKVDLRHPSVFVVDVGVWGPRGNLLGGRAQTILQPLEEIQYYLDWIQTTFPSSHVVYVYDNKHSDHENALKQASVILDRLLQIADDGNGMVLRKDIVMNGMPESLPCGHGCAGPVMEVVARLFLDWLAEANLRSRVVSQVKRQCYFSIFGISYCVDALSIARRL
jgi:hypothetical protein